MFDVYGYFLYCHLMLDLKSPSSTGRAAVTTELGVASFGLEDGFLEVATSSSTNSRCKHIIDCVLFSFNVDFYVRPRIFDYYK